MALTLLDTSSPPTLLDGWLLKKKALYRPSTLANATVRSCAGGLFWRRCYFALGAEKLEYWNTPEERQAGQPARGAYPLDNINFVSTQQQDVVMQFAQRQRTGLKNRERQALCVRAAFTGEAEQWGTALKKNVARSLSANLPYHWNMVEMLSDANAPVRLVAEVRLEDSTIAAVQKLVDHCFISKKTKDRGNADLPVCMEVTQVVGVQNFAAWTKYGRSRAGVASRCLFNQSSLAKKDQDGSDELKVDPPPLTSTHGERLVSTILGQLDKGANEHFLFHGTRKAAVEGITRGDFRLDLAGSHRGTLYGKGLYLAECSSKADEYAEEDPDGVCRMLLCRVSLGRVLVDRQAKPNGAQLVERASQEGFDSVCGDRWSAVGTLMWHLFCLCNPSRTTEN